MSRWIPLLTCVASALLGCGPVVQDLGGEPIPSPTKDGKDAGHGGFDDYDPNKRPDPTPTPSTETSCPVARPGDFGACEMLEAAPCRYRAGGGCTATCICGVDGRWVCFDTGCSSFTTSACTEGAPCDEATSCSLATIRTCQCLSSGRLHCWDAVPR